MDSSSFLSGRGVSFIADFIHALAAWDTGGENPHRQILSKQQADDLVPVAKDQYGDNKHNNKYQQPDQKLLIFHGYSFS
jgi:hypothetical protein